MEQPLRMEGQVLNPGQMALPGASLGAGRFPGCKPLPKRLPVQLLAMRWMGTGRRGEHHRQMLVRGPSPEWRQGDLLLSYPPPSDRRPGASRGSYRPPSFIVHILRKFFETFSWRLNKCLGSSVNSNFHIF